MSYDAILQQSLKDLNVVNESVRLFFKQGQSSFDAFDDILLQIAMHVMVGKIDLEN